MSEFNPTHHPHRRFNPLTSEFVLVSPHRNKRPWLGQIEPPQPLSLPPYDPGCYLCPGNSRAGGERNPNYIQTYSFENDFAAILPAPAPLAPPVTHHLFQAKPIHGGCDVLIFHPRHDLTFARLTIPDIVRVIDEWASIYLNRGSQTGIEYVQIFENKGSAMGCSNPHPHGQVWSLSEIPTIPAKELEALRRYSMSEIVESGAPKGPKGRPCMLCEYSHAEFNQIGEEGSRIVVHNEHWIAVVPWWATWPYETLLMPYKRHIQSILHLTAAEKLSFADILSKVTVRYDNLFSCPFPYSMGIHQRPIPISKHAEIDGMDDDMDIAHLHVHYSPPLLRSANVKKFLVGFEMMAEAQRDLTPEQAAAKLRQVIDQHYLDTSNN
ncbi:galactose-1-phosphate uridyl transferase [Amanita muscaria]